MDHSKKAVAVFDQFAKLYESKYMDVSKYADSLDMFCDQIIIKNPSVLELACGPGNVTKYLLEKRPDFQLLGTDLSPKMLELAAQNVPKARFKNLDCREIKTLDSTYNGIMVSFCLPYLTFTETQKLILDCYDRLKKGGVLYLSAIEGNYASSTYQKGSNKDIEEIFMHYYLAEDLTVLLEKQGFKVMLEDKIQYKDKLENLVTDLAVIGKKQ